MIGDFSFSSRVILLLSLMIVFAGLDLFRNGRKATRFKEYGFIVLAGIIGCCIGFFNNLMTSSISPEYFVLGKGLSEGEGLRLAAGSLGLRTGFSGGIIGGAICLFGCGRKVAFADLFRRFWMPVAGAIGLMLILPLVASQFDPMGYGEQLKDVATVEQVRKLLIVWWIHTGLYAGLIGGVVFMIVTLRRKQSAVATTP